MIDLFVIGVSQSHQILHDGVHVTSCYCTVQVLYINKVLQLNSCYYGIKIGPHVICIGNTPE